MKTKEIKIIMNAETEENLKYAEKTIVKWLEKFFLHLKLRGFVVVK